MTVSFCVCLKNRGKLFLGMLNALKACGPDITLCVFDFGSTDLTLERTLARSGVPFVLRQVDEPFNRSRGLNGAAELATGERLFFLDADMLVPPDFAQRVRNFVQPGQCWFPVCYSLHERKPARVWGDSRADAGKANGWWRATGYGMSGWMREDYDRVGGWNVSQGETWGGEDDDIHRRAKAAGLQVVRENCDGLFHQWHPNDRAWKERFHARGSETIKSTQAAQAARAGQAGPQQPDPQELTDRQQQFLERYLADGASVCYVRDKLPAGDYDLYVFGGTASEPLRKKAQQAADMIGGVVTHYHCGFSILRMPKAKRKQQCVHLGEVLDKGGKLLSCQRCWKRQCNHFNRPVTQRDDCETCEAYSLTLPEPTLSSAPLPAPASASQWPSVPPS